MKNKTIDDEKSIKCEKQIKIKTHRLPECEVLLQAIE